jgi:hypothetical protein
MLLQLVVLKNSKHHTSRFLVLCAESDSAIVLLAHRDPRTPYLCRPLWPSHGKNSIKLRASECKAGQSALKRLDQFRIILTECAASQKGSKALL